MTIWGKFRVLGENLELPLRVKYAGPATWHLSHKAGAAVPEGSSVSGDLSLSDVGLRHTGTKTLLFACA